jgi:hypothetical protein
MHVGGIAWWLLVGMFGWGACVGLLLSVWAGRRITSVRQGEAVWWEPLFRGFLALAGVVVIPLSAGIVAVVLTLVAHRAGLDKPLSYLAGIGYVFLLVAASWAFRTVNKPAAR